MLQILGTGGIFAFFELEEEIHPVVGSVENSSATE